MSLSMERTFSVASDWRSRTSSIFDSTSSACDWSDCRRSSRSDISSASRSRRPFPDFEKEYREPPPEPPVMAPDFSTRSPSSVTIRKSPIRSRAVSMSSTTSVEPSTYEKIDSYWAS